MSRTQESVSSSITSPVSKRYSMQMNTGKISYQQGDDGIFNEVPLPFHFILLDSEAFRIAGKNMALKRNIKSNLAHRKLAPIVSVFYEKDTNHAALPLASGLWRDIKEQVTEVGGRWSYVLYAATPDGEIITLTLRGRGGSEWLKFLESQGLPQQKDAASYFADSYFSITGTKIFKGDVDSYVPVFSMGKISKQETKELANRLDVEVAVYFNQLFNKTDGAQAAPPPDDDNWIPGEEPADKEDEKSGLPF